MDDLAELAPETGAAEADWLRVTASPGLTGWMAEQRVSLACTTYQSGKLMLLGRKADGGLAVFERNFARAMGLWGDGQSLLMSTQFQLWRLENVLRPQQVYDGHDRLFVPRLGITTGDLDVHDVAIEAGGRPVFAATGFNCVGTTHDRYSFAPIWRPPFISALAAEDRCHLNGIALEGGRLRYATAVAASDEANRWRDHRRDGGLVLEIPSGEPVATGLSMPHSPRIREGELWLLNSGTGQLGKVDRSAGRFEPAAFCPGYLRGLAFVGEHHAVVGLSKPRRDGTFGGLALDKVLARRGEEAVCGLAVVDLRSGEAVHSVRFEGMVSELYDVAILPGATRPMALGFKGDGIRRIVAAAEPADL
ncbi:TIGR03032 family protein [Tundrisphaera lichenicola]|uniref:TIGR03032 family protein n=1 Tax=Tundrisphaera lichenicola TaxID=2029860 RepID=UPI003EBB03A9